ncbi:MAG TPA: sigma-70 family RNA polymerase sigma factor [Planctomycetota bacterium]|nr:sigma-70 family RNA polymerase sigma factor [Planctomycetota bacterium]
MGNQDTALHQGQSRFPATSWSLLSHLRDPHDSRMQEYLSRMIETYWRPVYKFVRVTWKRSNEDAKDLTQAFFVHVMEGELLARATAERGNFRKLLLAALRNFLSNEHRSDHAQKRGGGKVVVSLDAPTEGGSAQEVADPEAAFESQWAREVLERALDGLARDLRPEVFAAFRKFHLDQLPVRRIATELRVTEAQVGHFLQDARSALRVLVTREIRDYVQDESQVGRELDALFKGWQ